MIMHSYDVTFKRMSESIPQHLLHVCDSIERAVELTREQYPGSLIINVILVS